MEKLSITKSQSWLGWFFRGILILGFLILIGRLFELQVIKGDYYRDLSEGNRIRRVPIMAPRGKIYARGGEVLVGNKEIKKRIVFKPESGFEKLDDLVGAEEEEIVSEWIRNYTGSSFGHITGYLGEVSEDELGKVDPECLEKGPREMGVLVGRSGLEQEYECKLRGIDGEELVEVDSTGKRIRVLGRREPLPGEDIQTSIHFNLQERVAEIMKDKKGAVIVTDAKGEVLALYSSPSFNPNTFISGSSPKIEKVLNDEEFPLFNRAIGGGFVPGSVYKPIVVIAALEEKEIDKNFIYEDTGQITIETPLGDFTYSNWYFNQYGGVEGEINVVRAIARSTDTFFYKLGEFVGMKKLVDWSHKFGLGKETGIDLPGEIPGLIPSPEWKERVKGERWFLGNTYHVAIGQGDLALTPIGVNTAISVIASDGDLCLPRIVETPKCQDLKIADRNLKLVRQGMVEACRQGGTGLAFFGYNPGVACKTGTAETGEKDESHAWFSVFAPSDSPEIMATVLVEKGGEGSRVAAPLARQIFDFWFHNIEDVEIIDESSE